MNYPVLAVCETCGKVFWSLAFAGKFCDNPRCQGYLRHILRRGVNPTESRGSDR